MIKCRSPFDGRAKVSRSSISDMSSVLSKRRQSPLREFRWTRGVCLDVCRNAARATKNFLAFAGMLQMLRKTFWRLQECCKSHEKLSGVCRNAASATKNFLAFATPLQVSRKTFWRLQHCCKSREKLSGVCNTVASLTKNFSAFATPLQAFPKTFGPSRGFRRNSLLAVELTL